jgi:hypothetical protein
MEMVTPLRLVLPLSCGVETRPAARCSWWWRAAKEAATAMAIFLDRRFCEAALLTSSGSRAALQEWSERWHLYYKGFQLGLTTLSGPTTNVGWTRQWGLEAKSHGPSDRLT